MAFKVEQLELGIASVRAYITARILGGGGGGGRCISLNPKP